MRVIDLFSCIGGHAIGLTAAGPFKTVRFCEINPQRRAFLSSKFPGTPIHDDVCTLHGKHGEADIIVGGPPCQRTSVAASVWGGRTGETLWPEMLRIGINVGVQWFVVEQPPGNKTWEAKVSHDLATTGFHSSRIEFSARDLGAPYLRRRVFILACTCIQRLAVAWTAIPSEIDRFKRTAVTGNHWIAGPPRTLRVANGISNWLDRNASVEAIGDSNPPGMMTVIGRAILHGKHLCSVCRPHTEE